ncbi:DUF5999 family protein [Streptomyces sp. NPDC002867]
MCTHEHPCPSATGSDREAAHVVQSDETLGWSLLCNGLVVFDTSGAQVPQGCVVRPSRATPTTRPAA